MARALYLTHPQVAIDPACAIHDWGLSDVGRARAQRLADSGALGGVTRVVSSAERKARETAAPIAAALGLTVDVRAAMHENDRSATGFLPPARFEEVANLFFARPEESVLGWERAIDAQARIVAEVDACLRDGLSGDILFVGHGAVGTLLWCALSGVPISRAHDQTPGGGCWFAFDAVERRPGAGWRAMEALTDG
jgi:broad specificity phosphatase PhoE